MLFGVQLSTWDGRPTRHVPLRPWTADRHGTWYRWPAGAPSRTPDGSELRYARDFVVLVPGHGGWMARWGREGAVDLHVKVTTATAATEHGISAVDLDLDVVRFVDGRAAVMDQDTFDRRRVTHAYPADVVGRALATARMLYRALHHGDAPFVAAGDRHLAALGRAVPVGAG